jgi:hypothetical protein
MELALFAPILFIPAVHRPLAGTLGLTFAPLPVAPLPRLFSEWERCTERDSMRVVLASDGNEPMTATVCHPFTGKAVVIMG